MEIQELQNQLSKLTRNELENFTLTILEDKQLLQDKLKTWLKITDEVGWKDMREVAKVLHDQFGKYKIYGRNMIFALLRDAKIIMQNNEPYQTYIDRGYFKQIETEKYFGSQLKLIPKTLVSMKGIDLIRNILDEINTEK